MPTPICRATALAFLLVAAGPSGTAAQSTGPTGRDTSRLFKQGLAGLDARQYPAALTAFAEAARANPHDSSLSLGAGVAAFMLGRHDAAQVWFERALESRPRNATALEWLGELHYRAGRVDTAIAMYERALAGVPQSSETDAFGPRLASWRREAEVHARFAEIRGEGAAVRFRASRDEALASRVLERVEAARLRVAGILGTFPSQPVAVVLYTREEFAEITRLPTWSVAAYDGRIRLPLSGAPDDGEDLDRVLTHELVHAVVATLAGRNAPVWLNEGLATALEPKGSADAEAPLSSLSREGARPSLASLSGSFLQLDIADVPVAYALSARAVRRMTELGGTPAIVGLLQDLGGGVPMERAFQQRLSMRYAVFEAALARD